MVSSLSLRPMDVRSRKRTMVLSLGTQKKPGSVPGFCEKPHWPHFNFWQNFRLTVAISCQGLGNESHGG